MKEPISHSIYSCPKQEVSLNSVPVHQCDKLSNIKVPPLFWPAGSNQIIDSGKL